MLTVSNAVDTYIFEITKGRVSYAAYEGFT